MQCSQYEYSISSQTAILSKSCEAPPPQCPFLSGVLPRKPYPQARRSLIMLLVSARYRPFPQWPSLAVTDKALRNEIRSHLRGFRASMGWASYKRREWSAGQVVFGYAFEIGTLTLRIIA